MADITHMIKTNISKDQIKFLNLHKSFFSDLNNTSIEITDNKVMIYDSSNQNSDPASVELAHLNNFYIVHYFYYFLRFSNCLFFIFNGSN